MVVVATDHTDKNGRSKIKQICTLPLTGAKCVSRIITNLCVFDVDRVNGTLTLVGEYIPASEESESWWPRTELAEGVTVEEVTQKTEAKFFIAEKLGNMDED
jgi:3-oxoacid CoA-transferase